MSTTRDPQRATAFGHLSDEELLERLAPPDEEQGEDQPLGDFSIEAAVGMGAFFEDPAEEAAFGSACRERGLRRD